MSGRVGDLSPQQQEALARILLRSVPGEPPGPAAHTAQC
ncbi:SEC14L4 isoform 3 [Pan troglodytes]|uniref:SEC14L4 isoform 3 n=1 Tax=Pan troglodytes TaxID=9598 RepID=A0A2J8QNQ0_PANTR|nr:SEC14L4 isoform 3 [Pan troglodytes]